MSALTCIQISMHYEILLCIKVIIIIIINIIRLILYVPSKIGSALPNQGIIKAIRENSRIQSFFKKLNGFKATDFLSQKVNFGVTGIPNNDRQISSDMNL